MKLIRDIARHFVGYEARIHWAGSFYKHYAWTEQGALDWVACYPRDSEARIERILTGYIHAARIA